jgi:hypothetical protein
LVFAVSAGSSLFAQGIFRTTTPGSAFSPEGPAGRVSAENLAGGGRKFRGGERQPAILRGTLQIPAATSAEPRLQKIVVHFRTTDGPRLLSVELHNGSDVRRRETNVTGDYMTREMFKPANTANAWEFQSMSVRSPLVVRLSVEFGGGFEGIADPGDFVLIGVVAEFPRKPLGSLETTASVDRAGPMLGVPSSEPAKSIGRVHSTSEPAAPARSICESARNARARNSPAAPNLEAQCRAIGEAPPAPAAVPAGRPRGVTYDLPTILAANGQTLMLDFCRDFGSACGKPAADAFCRQKGHPDASRFQKSEDIGHTAIISTGAICDDPSCDGFTKIQCNPNPE